MSAHNGGAWPSAITFHVPETFPQVAPHPPQPTEPPVTKSGTPVVGSGKRKALSIRYMQLPSVLRIRANSAMKKVLAELGNQVTALTAAADLREMPSPGNRTTVARVALEVDDALKAYADVLRIDEARNGVRVATVAPGPTTSI